MFYPYVTWVPWTLVAAGAITFISLILLILSLTVVGNDDDDDDNDAKSNFDNEDFGRFTNYSRIDDKFNHIQTSTFKTSNSLIMIMNINPITITITMLPQPLLPIMLVV